MSEPLATELEQLLRRLVREELRRELAEREARRAAGESDPVVVDDDVEQLAAERAAKLRSARPKGGGR